MQAHWFRNLSVGHIGGGRNGYGRPDWSGFDGSFVVSLGFGRGGGGLLDS